MNKYQIECKNRAKKNKKKITNRSIMRDAMKKKMSEICEHWVVTGICRPCRKQMEIEKHWDNTYFIEG